MNDYKLPYLLIRIVRMDSIPYTEHASSEAYSYMPSLEADAEWAPEETDVPQESDGSRLPSSYLSAAKRTVFLSWEEEQALVTRARAGDDAARKRLIESHLPLVIGIARSYSNKGLPIADLIQEGNIGLIRGVDRFCPEMGTRLSSYATFWIREGMQRSLIRSRLIRLPDYLAKSLHARKQVLERREEQLAMGIETEESEDQAAKNAVLDAMTDIQVLSLDAPHGDDSDHTMLDHLEADLEEPESVLDHSRIRDALIHCMQSLSAKQRQVIMLRFGLEDGEPMTLEEVASKLGTSREAVRQLQVRALRCLKQSFESAGWAGVEG